MKKRLAMKGSCSSWVMMGLKILVNRPFFHKDPQRHISNLHPTERDHGCIVADLYLHKPSWCSSSSGVQDKFFLRFIYASGNDLRSTHYLLLDHVETLVLLSMGFRTNPVCVNLHRESAL
jgi:hypothetical protein